MNLENLKLNKEKLKKEIINLTNESDKEINIKTKNNGLIVINKKQENYTLEDLKQKLINIMFNKNYYNKVDAEIIKIIFENNDI